MPASTRPPYGAPLDRLFGEPGDVFDERRDRRRGTGRRPSRRRRCRRRSAGRPGRSLRRADPSGLGTGGGDRDGLRLRRRLPSPSSTCTMAGAGTSPAPTGPSTSTPEPAPRRRGYQRLEERHDVAFLGVGEAVADAGFPAVGIRHQAYSAVRHRIYSFLEGLEAAVVEIGRGLGDRAQRGRLEHAAASDVLGPLAVVGRRLMAIHAAGLAGKQRVAALDGGRRAVARDAVVVEERAQAHKAATAYRQPARRASPVSARGPSCGRRSWRGWLAWIVGTLPAHDQPAWRSPAPHRWACCGPRGRRRPRSGRRHRSCCWCDRSDGRKRRNTGHRPTIACR